MAKEKEAADVKGPAIGQMLDPVSVGSRLRKERMAQGVGLRQLARQVGVSPSLISQIERGRANPSVGTLFSIVTELNMSLDELFSPESAGNESGAERARDKEAGGDGASPVPTAELSTPVVRAGEGDAIQLASGVTWERLTPSADPDVEFLYVVYEPGGASAEGSMLICHGGKEHGYVLEGRLNVTVAFDTYALGPGDAISFDSTTPHRLDNLGDEPVRAIFFIVGRRGDPRMPRE